MSKELITPITATMNIIQSFVERVGFPILAFCLMFWMANSTLNKVTESIDANSKALIKLSVISEEFRKQVTDDHKQLTTDISNLFLIKINE